MDSAKKNKINLTIFLIFSAVSLNAQNYPTHLGIKGGINFSSLTSKSTNLINDKKFDKRQTVGFGIFFDTRVNYHLRFESGFDMALHGAVKNGYQAFPTQPQYLQYFPQGQAPEYLFSNYNSETKLNYLMSNSIVKAGSNSDKKFNFYLGAGFYMAYLLSAKYISSGNSLVYRDEQRLQPISSNNFSFDETKNIRGELHKFDLGLLGRLELSMNLGKHKIYIEGGGNYGLININKNKDLEKRYNKSLSVNIKYAINIGQLPFIPD